jgi:Cof subfamily protein (haloacid dehalogenase superfamily)
VRFRALAIDLDGTLLDPAEQISPRCLAALDAAKARGIEVVIASARWQHVVREVAERLSVGGVALSGPAIACSGAQVFRLSDDTDLLDVRLPAEFAGALYTITDHQRCVVWAALDDEVLVKLEGDPVSLPVGLRQVATVGPHADVAPRMLLVQGAAAVGDVRAELEEAWRDRVRFVESFSSRGKLILTITAQGGDKGRALTVACQEMGIDPSEVVAFGDAENDIAMFDVAGASFAMGQANDEVKARASAVTSSNIDDGVAVALERLLLLGDKAFE